MNLHIRKDLAIIISSILALTSLLPSAMQAHAHETRSLLVERAVAEIAADDPSVIGQWSELMEWPVVAIHASLLPNGKLLTWDATPDDFDGDPHENDSSTMRTDLWDPATNTHQSYNPDTNSDMFCSGHAHLSDGSLFVAGGDIDQDQPIDKTNIFSWQDNSWSSASSMSYSRWYPSVAAMPNEEMLVIGGSPSIPEVWSAENGWRSLTTAPIELTKTYYHWIQPTLDGRALLFGPSPSLQFLDTSGTGAWTDIGRREQLYRHYGIYAMYDIGKIMIAGGGADAANSAVTLSMQSGEVTEIPPMQYGRRQHNGTILADGKVFVSGGLSSGAPLIDMNSPVYATELWDPNTLAWTTMASMQVTRQYHSTALLLPDGRVWSGGGGYCTPCREVGYEADSAEIFSPPYLFKADGSGELADRPSIGFAPQNVAYGRTFDVSSPDAGEIAQVNLVRLSSVTHSTNMDQRFVPLQFDQDEQTLTIEAPGNAAIAPSGYYMLFIVNGVGVPSEAAFIRFYNSPDSPTFVPTPVIPEQLIAPTADNIVNWPEYDSEFLVTWSAVENVNQYELESWSEETDWQLVAIVQGLAYQISNQPLGHWCFRTRSVRADALASSWSNNVCTDVNEVLPSTPTSAPTSAPTNTQVPTPIPPTAAPTTIIEPTIAPTATAIPPLPTATPVPTQTPTLPPLPTDTPTLTPVPTDTPVPIMTLTAPDLFEIDNGPDFDNYYVLEWSPIPDAESFNLEEWSGQSGWRSIGGVTQNRYEVQEQDLGYWCHRVQAQRVQSQRGGEYSDWSVVRCTTVSIRQQSPTSTSVSPTAVTSTATAISAPTVASTPATTPEPVATSTPAIGPTPGSTPKSTSTPAMTSAPTAMPTGTETPTPIATTGSTATPIVAPEGTATATPVGSPTPSSGVEDPTTPNLVIVSRAEEIKIGNYMVQWSALADEVGYELQTWTSRNGWVTILAGTFTHFDAQGYGAGTWCYRVRANSPDGSTQWSNVDCVNITPSITILTQSSDPIGQAVEISVIVDETDIPLIQWQGEAGSKYHVWKSSDGRVESATRLTIEQMDDLDTYLLTDISELAYVHEMGERSASTYWLVERRGASTLVHGPFTATQVESTNRLYFPIVNL